VVGVEEYPGEGFDIKITDLKREPESGIVTVEIVGKAFESALVVGVMIRVMAQNEDEIFERIEPQGEVPVEFCPLAAIIVGNQLGEKGNIFGEEDTILKAKCPSIVFP
jgi:hypothetical protein